MVHNCHEVVGLTILNDSYFLKTNVPGQNIMPCDLNFMGHTHCFIHIDRPTHRLKVH